jgi:hypothetical protein
LQLNRLVLLGRRYDPRVFGRHITVTGRQFFDTFRRYVKPIRPAGSRAALRQCPTDHLSLGPRNVCDSSNILRPSSAFPACTRT